MSDNKEIGCSVFVAIIVQHIYICMRIGTYV